MVKTEALAIAAVLTISFYTIVVAGFCFEQLTSTNALATCKEARRSSWTRKLSACMLFLAPVIFAPFIIAAFDQEVTAAREFALSYLAPPAEPPTENHMLCADLEPSLIPRVIHRTFATPTPVYMRAYNLTARYNPCFEQIVYDDADMLDFVHHFGEHGGALGEAVQDAFHRLNPLFGAARADFFRYMLIYVKGGFYLDAKSAAYDLSTVLRADDELLLARWKYVDWPPVRVHSSINLGDWELKGELNQFWLAAAPRHPYYAEVLWSIVRKIDAYVQPSSADVQNCERYKALLPQARLPKLNMVMQLAIYVVDGCAGEVVLETTGPYVYTQAIHKMLLADASTDSERTGKLTGSAGRRVRFLPPMADDVVRYALEPHVRKGNHYSAQSAPLVLPHEKLKVPLPAHALLAAVDECCASENKSRSGGAQ